MLEWCLNRAGLVALLLDTTHSVYTFCVTRCQFSDVRLMYTKTGATQSTKLRIFVFNKCNLEKYTRVGTLIVATIYLQLIKNRYMFRSFTVLQCSHQHCVQPIASDVEVVGYL